MTARVNDCVAFSFPFHCLTLAIQNDVASKNVAIAINVEHTASSCMLQFKMKWQCGMKQQCGMINDAEWSDGTKWRNIATFWILSLLLRCQMKGQSKMK